MITILAIDDEPFNNAFMQRIFRKFADRKILTALSGEQGLQILSQANVDLLLVDYSMPDMTGVNFLKQARDNGFLAPALLVTGYPEMPDVVNAQKEGLVFDVVAKPIMTKILFEAIDSALKTKN